MSSYAGIVIGGVEVHEFSNHYDRWFFRKRDRVIECPSDDNDDTEGIFIGFRATAATIRRRMTLAGFDLPACERYFQKNVDNLLKVINKEIGRLNVLLEGHRLHEGGNNPGARLLDVYNRFSNAVKDTSLRDWIAAFPEAVALQHTVKGDFFHGAWWCGASENTLVNAMLSYVPTYRNYPATGIFNFPGPHWDQFAVALLASCPDDAVCELNVAELLTDDDDDNEYFRDLEEIQDEETEPHWGCREAVREIKDLSGTQPINDSLQRMCYASIITAMEAYLGDILKREIFSRPSIKQRFVASYEPFTKSKLTLAELYTKLSEIDVEIKDALDGLSLHKIETAKNIFSQTLLTDFPAQHLAFLGAAVKYRHDIVHRNGKNTDGVPLSIDHAAVEELAGNVLSFTSEIDAQILDGMQQEIDAEKD